MNEVETVPVNQPLRILVVEDHDALRDATVKSLSDMGHSVCGVGCAESMDETLPHFPADILLLDLGLPGEDGLSIAQRMRNARPGLGIIMTTARERPADVVAGYDSGADIYLSKPVSAVDINFAISTLTRRRLAARQTSDRLYLNPTATTLHGPSGMVSLSDGDYLVLQALATARERRLEAWQLLEVLDKEVDEANRHALAAHIARLRKKLEAVVGQIPTIRAVRGSGYQLCVNLTMGHGAG